MEDTNLKYKDAMIELDELITALEDNKLDIDDLSEKVKRIAFLIRFCKAKLSATEEEVAKILDEMK